MFRTDPALAPTNGGGIWDRVEALGGCQRVTGPQACMGTGLAASTAVPGAGSHWVVKSVF